jgi:hypothetical protein
MSKTPVNGHDEDVPADAPSSDSIDPESEAPNAERRAMPAPAKSGSHSASRILLAIVSPLLVIALVALAATAVYSYQTIQSTNNTLNETRLDLAHEQSAHRSADAQASGLIACVAVLNADEASLTKLSNDLRALQPRTLRDGDIEAARLTYEAALLKALTDEHKAVVAASWASTPAEWAAVNTLGLQGENEMKQAAALKSQLDSLVTDYQGAADEVYAEGPAVAAQVSNTAALCGFKPDSSAGPATLKASPSVGH